MIETKLLKKKKKSIGTKLLFIEVQRLNCYTFENIRTKSLPTKS